MLVVSQALVAYASVCLYPSINEWCEDPYPTTISTFYRTSSPLTIALNILLFTQASVSS